MKIFLLSWLVDEANKKNDFRKVVILQGLIIISALLLKDILELAGINDSYKFRDTLFLALGGIYIIVLWDLLRNFTTNPRLIYALLFLILGTYLLAIVTVNPFFQFISKEAQRPYLFFIHSVLFMVELTVIFFSISDLFSQGKLSQEKLWGAACVYLMIAISFGSLYDLINIIQPNALGANIQLGLESYTSCIYYSMSILVGHDPIYENPIRLIRNIGVIEGLWANLYIVLLVGKLLSSPEKE